MLRNLGVSPPKQSPCFARKLSCAKPSPSRRTSTTARPVAAPIAHVALVWHATGSLTFSHRLGPFVRYPSIPNTAFT